MKKTNIKAKKSARKDALHDNFYESKQLILAAQSLAEEQQNHIRRLEEIVKLFKANKFGKSSEKSPAKQNCLMRQKLKAVTVIRTCLQKQLNLNKQHQYLLQVLRKRAASRSPKIPLVLSSNMT
jgi:hypothetical protein